MTSPRTILSAIAVAAALTLGLAPAAHAGTTDPTDAVGTASPEPTAAETDDPVEPTDDPDPTSEPSVEPTTVAPPPDPTTSVAPPQPTSSSTPTSTSTSTATSTTTGTTTSSVAPTSSTSTTSVSSTATSTTAPVFYENCAAVQAAGQPLLFPWEPGYRTELDPDLDGIACEWHEHPGGTDEDRHRGDDPDSSSDDSWCTDNDWRTLIVVIPVIDQSSTSYTYYGDDDLDATYTQWPTVPDGPVATGQAG